MRNAKMAMRLSAFVCLAILTFACMGFYDAGAEPQQPNTISDSRDLEIYFFDPETSLKTLRQEGENILTPLTAMTADDYLDAGRPPIKSEAYLWKYEDYLRLLDVVQKQTWDGDSEQKWNLFRMEFFADCQDPLTGFSTGDIYFFRPVVVEDSLRYAVRAVSMRPLYGEIISGSGSTYPHSSSKFWESIDMSKINVTPNEALQKAEEHGGKDFRRATKNACYVDIYAPADQWVVIYTKRENHLERLEIRIDRFTGELEIQN